jgi:hypothetical protein
MNGKGKPYIDVHILVVGNTVTIYIAILGVGNTITLMHTQEEKKRAVHEIKYGSSMRHKGKVRRYIDIGVVAIEHAITINVIVLAVGNAIALWI